MKRFILYALFSIFIALSAFSHHAPQSSDDYYVVDCACNGGKCYQCGGTGVVYFMYMANNCPICMGSGKCSFCAGLGKRYIKKQPAAPASPVNNGGNNGNNSQRSSSRSKVYTTCKECGGGGGCKTCKGTGQVYSPSPYHNVSSYQTCPSCRGSKKCYMCHGTGRY